MRVYTSILIIILLVLYQLTMAQIPKTISYQGILTEGEEKVDGDKTFTFKLYESETGGASIWDNYRILNVKNGVFEVVLGKEKPLNLAFDKPYWLGVKVGSAGELTPRIPLSASAYSLNAQSVADGAAVKSINTIKDNVIIKAGENITVTSVDSVITISAAFSQATTNTLDKAYDQGGAGAGRTITADAGAVNIAGNGGLTVNGNTGIGTTSPSQKLDVKGTVQMEGFKMPAGAASGYVLQSDANGVGTWKAPASSGIGGSGSTNYLPRFTGATSLGNSELYQSGNRIGIGTTNPNTYTKLEVHNSSYYAGRFVSSLANSSTIALYSEATGTGNYNSTALYGKAIPADGYGYGGKFFGGRVALYAKALGGAYGGYTYGLYGYATGSAGIRIGVYGNATGGATNWAGYFNGHVKITGETELAKDAIEAYEIEDEPGIVQGMKSGSLTLTSSSTMQDIITVKITIPASGYIVLNGRTQFEFSGSTASQGAYMQIDESAGGGTLNGHYSAVYASQLPTTGYYSHNCTSQRTYYKSIGTYTFRLEAKRITNNGTTKCWQSILTAMYFPTSYGDVISKTSETLSKTESNSGDGVNMESKSSVIDLRDLELEALKKREEAERSERKFMEAQLKLMEEQMQEKDNLK